MTKRAYPRIQVRLNRWRTPTEFYWQGRRYRIEQIDRIWRHSQGQSRGSRLYLVQADGRRFLLHYERESDRWSLVRSPLRVRLGLSLTRLVAHLIT